MGRLMGGYQKVTGNATELCRPEPTPYITRDLFLSITSRLSTNRSTIAITIKLENLDITPLVWV